MMNVLVSCAKAKGKARGRQAGPVHGPFAELRPDPVTGEARVRLTAEGRAKVADYLDRYPHPTRLLIATWPAAYRAARIARLTDEEIEAVCREGVVRAFVRYDPARGAAVGTAIVWSLRAAIGNAVRQARRARQTVLVDFAALANLCEGVTIENARVRPPAAAESPGSAAADDLADALGRTELSARDREVLARRFGLDGRLPQTNAAIGADLGISPERVRQVQEQAIRRIRRGLGLDTDRPIVARGRVLTALRTAPGPTTKAELSRRAGMPKWQLREVLANLLAEGLLVRRRCKLSRSRWCVVYIAKGTRRSRVGA
jgi:RNA polymerase sigma factor (sigma-70 family)